MKGFSLELRVGLLLLVTLVIMGGFAFVLGGVSLKSRYQVFVDFDNPGSLKAGSPVRISGIDVGMVESLQYLGGKLDPKTGRHALVRAGVKLNEDVKATVRQDARFYVTSAGILGEAFLGLDPGSQSAPELAAESIVVGIDPPRLDQAFAKGYELLDTVVTGVRNNREELGELMDGAGGMLKSLNTAVGENGGEFEKLIAKAETMSGDAVSMIKGVRENYVEGRNVKQLVNTVDQTMQEVSPFAADVRTGVNQMFGPEKRAEIKTTISDVAGFAERSKDNLDAANKALGEMKRGEGTVGKLLRDQDMSDDFEEFVDDFKENPWKLFWAE